MERQYCRQSFWRFRHFMLFSFSSFNSFNSIKSFLFSFSNVDEFYNSKFNSLTAGAGRGFALTSDFKGRRDHLYILDSWQPDLFAPPLGPDLKGPFPILLTPIRLLKNNYQYRSYKNIRWPSKTNKRFRPVRAKLNFSWPKLLGDWTQEGGVPPEAWKWPKGF